MLKVEALTKKSKDGFALQNISFEQHYKEKLVIAGATGSGKSSLLKLIGGLDQADNGAVYFNDEKVKGIYEKLMPGHKKIAYLSQQYELLNNYYVNDLLSYPNNLSNDEAAELYALCRIDHLLKRRTNELSGGERQRIALARLLITLPELLLLDEPYSNLDMQHKKILQQVLKDVDERLNTSFILVSHDAADILSWAEKIIVLKNGNIVQQGSSQEIYMKPANEYVASLFGDFNFITLNNQQVFIRPEHVIISENKTATTLKGFIKNIIYYGSYYQLQIMINQQLIKANITNNTFHINDEVNIIFPAVNNNQA